MKLSEQPVRFHRRIQNALADEPLQAALAKVKDKFIVHRQQAILEYNETGDFESLREHGHWLRDQCITQMPSLLEQFSKKAEAAGTVVLYAKTATRARQLIIEIAKKHQVRLTVKSKSMATEEINLNAALINAGVETIETDMGEFILQLGEEKPSHIIAPAMHKTKEQVSSLFSKHLQSTAKEIGALTKVARETLRDKFLKADMGISGANFLIADSGSTLIVTNEGNGRMTTTLPKVHVTLAGVDKILPSLTDVPDMLALLTRSATGQRLSNYVSVVTGCDKQQGRQTYVILLDNGRLNLVGSPYQDMLRCIRCGACMNHCPVYHTIGGHAYGSTYMGPMGQVLSPALWGLEAFPDLHQATTMCHACEVACPVKIPLPQLMRQLREDQVKQKKNSIGDNLLMKLWFYFAMRPWGYRLLLWVAKRGLKLIAAGRDRICYFPGLSWFQGRDLPIPQELAYRFLQKEEKE